MIKVLIIDDEQSSINVIIEHLKDYNDYCVCGSAKTVHEAIELTYALKPNLVFLDIVLGSETGFDYLNAFLPNIDFNIIFTTAYNNYAVKAFEYSALHYLLKPIDIYKFQEALARMNDFITQQERLEQLQSLEHNIQNINGYIFIHIATLDKNYKISTKDILFIQADSNYTHFHLLDKTKITSSKTLKFYTDLLVDSHFYKVHKSYLVNVEQMKTYDRKTGELIMSDATFIPVAIRRQKEFVNTYFK